MTASRLDREPASELSVVIPADADHLVGLRRAVRAFLASHDAPIPVVDDLELAVSELATNVVRHTDSDTVSIRLTRSSSSWTLDVADADGVPPIDDAVLPAPTEETGRGLVVVRTVLDSVGVEVVDGVQVVRGVRSISA